MAVQIVGRRRGARCVGSVSDGRSRGRVGVAVRGRCGDRQDGALAGRLTPARERGIAGPARAHPVRAADELRDRRRPVRASPGGDAAAARARPAACAGGRVPDPRARRAAARGTTHRDGASLDRAHRSSRSARSSSRSTMRSGSIRARLTSSASCSGGWRAEPVAVLATVRGLPVEAPFELDRAFAGFRRLPVAPLSVGAIHRLLWGRLSLNLPRPVLVARARGHGREPVLRARGRARAGRRHDQRRRRPRPLPESLRALVAERLGALPAQVRETLVAVAALGAPSVTLLEPLRRHRRRRHRAGLPTACPRARRRPDPFRASSPRTRLLRGHAAAQKAPPAPPPRRSECRSGRARTPPCDLGRRPRRGDRSRARRCGGARTEHAAPPWPRPSSPSARSR